MQTYALVALRAHTIKWPGGTSVAYLQDQVVNTLLWDGESAFDPGPDLTLVPVPDGWTVLDRQLVEIPPAVVPEPQTPPTEPSKAELMAQVQALLAKIEALPGS